MLSEKAQAALARFPEAYEYKGYIIGWPSELGVFDEQWNRLLPVDVFDAIVSAAHETGDEDRLDAARWRYMVRHDHVTGLDHGNHRWLSHEEIAAQIDARIDAERALPPSTPETP